MKYCTAFFVLAITTVSACASADDSASAIGENVELPAGVTREMVAAGQQLFNQQTCFTCHGRNAAGGPLAPALDDGEWLNTDGSYDAIVAVIRDGVPQPRRFTAPMPAMGGTPLQDEQIRQLAAYVYAVSRAD
jgi:mono/diheme cytochrome c family protein